jgi:RHS repeat-associated protein
MSEIQRKDAHESFKYSAGCPPGGILFGSVVYDNANRLSALSQGTATIQFTYDNDNRRQTVILSNGIVLTYGFDAASQLTSMTYTLGSSTIGSLTYGYDLAGRRAMVGGNLARTLLPLPISQTIYNASNQLVQWGATNIFYDANGNMKSIGSDGYAWDARNRLVSTLSGAAFQYDAFGRRTQTNIGTTTTKFLYDGPNAVQQLSGITPIASMLLGGIDENFQRTDSSGARVFLTDALGSTLALTDSSGALQTQYSYEPFGNTVVSGAASPNTAAFTGRELDPTGLYFNRARYYSPNLQRFISEDPIGFKGRDVNLYAYTGNSPTNFTDSSGRLPSRDTVADNLAAFAIKHGNYIPAICSADSFRFYGGGLEDANQRFGGVYKLDDVHYVNGPGGPRIAGLESDLLFEGGNKNGGFGVVTDMTGRKAKEGLVFVPVSKIEGGIPHVLNGHAELGFVGGLGKDGVAIGFYGEGQVQAGSVAGALGGGWALNVTSLTTCMK